ncbi:hypothetical protein ACH5RR_008456 [Cinchona calisaya]|uniref:Uncharacterized protein n=1 Tax=Cinchona calisaya TaxID=153742 RepID=A0ABD3ABT0_9GENT
MPWPLLFKLRFLDLRNSGKLSDKIQFLEPFYYNRSVETRSLSTRKVQIGYPKKLGPCAILEKFASNAYRVQFPNGRNSHETCNISHLQPYFGEFEDLNLRMSSFSGEGTNGVHLDDLDKDSSSSHYMSGC